LRGIDSNILLRLLTEDDPEQLLLANRLKANSDGAGVLFVNVIVILEIIWVLRRRYRMTQSEVLVAIDNLIVSRDIELEDQGTVIDALVRAGELNVDFADCLIALRNQQLGCEITFTFDRKAARLSEFRLLMDPEA
jgi:predicted nucleic-acid-binding protein